MNDKKIKVAYVVHGLGAEGISLFTLNLLENIDYNKFDIYLFMAVDDDGVKQFKEDDLLSKTNNCVKIFRTNDLNGFHRIVNHCIKLKKYFKELGPFDAVHSNMDLLNGFVLTVAKFSKIPVRISHAHKAAAGNDSNFLKSQIKKRYTKLMKFLIKKNSTKMIGCSDKACNFMYPDSEYEIIINGIDTKRFNSPQNTNSEDIKNEIGVNNKKVIVSVARINKNKNPIFALQIVQELLKIRDDFVYLWYGNSENKEEAGGKKSTKQECEDYISLNSLDEYFRFMGITDKVPEILSISDVFLLLSYNEAMPISIVEAECANCQCLVSDTITRLVEADGMCKFLPLGEENATLWAEQINEILSKTSKQKISDEDLLRFDSKNMTKRISDCYLGKV